MLGSLRAGIDSDLGAIDNTVGYFPVYRIELLQAPFIRVELAIQRGDGSVVQSVHPTNVGRFQVEAAQ